MAEGKVSQVDATQFYWLIPAFVLASVAAVWGLGRKTSAQLDRLHARGPTPCLFLLTTFGSRHSWGAELFVLADSFYVRMEYGGIHFVRTTDTSERIGIPLLTTRAVVKRVEADGHRLRVHFGGFVPGRVTLTGLSEEDQEDVVRAVSSDGRAHAATRA